MNVNDTQDKKHKVSPSRQWDAFWEKTAQSDRSDDELGAAKASRTQAETTRQMVANEILEATRDVCQRLMSDAERSLERARYLESEAESIHQKAEDEQAQAQSVRSEADAYRESAIAEGSQKAQEIQDNARSEAERECADLRGAAAREAQRVIGQAEVMKSAAREELEAQKLYAEAARLKAESHEILAQIESKVEPVAESNGKVEPVAELNGKVEPVAEPSGNGTSDHQPTMEAPASDGAVPTNGESPPAEAPAPVERRPSRKKKSNRD